MSNTITRTQLPPTRSGSRRLPLEEFKSSQAMTENRAQTPEIPNDDLVQMRHTSSASLIAAYNRASGGHAVETIKPLSNNPLLKLSKEEKPKRDYIKYPFMLYEDSDHYYYSDNSQNFWQETRSNMEESKNEKTKDISSGVTNFEEGDDELREELYDVHTQTKAKTLWALSSGLSTLEKSSSPFGRDEKVVNLDVKSIISRPSSSRSSRSARSNPLVPGPFRDLIDAVDASGTKFQEIDESKDPTKRTYMTDARGRSVSSIYHPNTKRPSRISNLVENVAITNESLYTYISTENVTILDLERCVDIGNKVLKSIGEFCPRLKSLNLQHCSQLRDSTIRIIVNGCADLQNINIGMCHLITDDSIVEIFTHCRKLTVMSLHSCELVTGEISFPLTKNTPNLQVVDISYCTKFSDIALQFLSEYCPNLHHLDISGCPLIQDEGLISICKHCPQLRTLRATILSQPTITNETLSFITNYARGVEVLELSGVFQIRDQTVQEICKFAQRLEFLSLSGCPQITDASIHTISETCHNLKCLEVAGCRKIGVQALLELIHKVTKLRRLVVTRCNISAEELDILQKFTNGRVAVLKQEPKPKEIIREYFTIEKEQPKKKKKVVKKKDKKAK
nr:unnamed protein product [Naegleria fowleri]